MSNQVVVNLQQADTFYKRYRKVYPQRNDAKTFSFDTNVSITDNLHQLSLFALNETLPVLYCYSPIFLDVIGRWIENPLVDKAYKGTLGLSEFKLDGSMVLYALSKLVQVSKESMNMIEFYLEKNNVFDLLESVEKVSVREVELVLLAYYRLLNDDFFKFNKFVNPKTLNTLLTTEIEGFNLVKYLSVLLLGVYMESSEETTDKMLAKYVNMDDLISDYEGDRIDYKFLNLVEAKRINNFLSLQNDKPHTKDTKRIVAIDQTQLCGVVTSIYGVLVPNLSAFKTQNHQEIEFGTESFVATDNSIRVLRNTALNIQHNVPTLLYGQAGSGKTFLFNQLSKLMAYQDSIVKIHLGEQTDAKLLLGTYSSGDKPGTFKWRSGVLTTAVKQGKWVLIEDIDKAPTEVLSILLTLLEKRQLIIPSRGEVIKAHNNFQIISTIRTTGEVPDLIGLRLWKTIEVETPNEYELVQILTKKFPSLKNLIKTFIRCFNEILAIYTSNSFVSLNRGSHPRIISLRDLVKFCSRCDRILLNANTTTEHLLESSVYDNFFQEAIDCFGSAITEHDALIPLTNVIGECLEVPASRINLFMTKHIPLLLNDDASLTVGRAKLNKLEDITFSKSGNSSFFATTNHSLRLMEQICVSLQMVEPVLLVGETGTGKTTVVQQIAKLMHKKLTVINVSQQTESGDLLGGYKPVNTKIIAIPLQEVFENLFITTFSRKKNEKFSLILSKVFNRNQWKNVIKLWREAIKMSKELLSAKLSAEEETTPKKRKLQTHEQKVLLDKWVEFEIKVKEFEIQSSSLDNSFVFNFVEGSLVNAIRNGDWLLLDEINLASSDTLESIADLLAEADQRSILLSEKGDIDPIKAHPEFRIFGCMNPSTDVGKKDLPLSIRSRFSEIYVHSPDRDFNDLLAIINKYISRFTVGDELIDHDIANLYLEAKKLSESNKIVDGANQKPHFSIRTLTRTLVYVVDIIGIYGLRRSLYEGFCMSFLTLLDIKSEKLLKPLIEQYTIAKLKNMKSVMSQAPPNPGAGYVQFKHYWMKQGPLAIVPQPNYIITPFVEKNMLNLVRATAGRRFPVLIQGPTSAGKTSMIHYLASITGHKFVRINNHEHTDLQEYLGTYISDSTGKLTFKEGILVEAIRNGYWIVLDELNLAPTDILEALNRLLDDNRELFIPETQEVVHPHPDFMLFATQNPPGIYGGRKMLSRAFRNRFLELHFDDIPQDELEIILKERCQIAPSYCKRIVEVYKQLSIQRQSTRLFEQKNSFATLRDLFRWAFRDAVGYEELAANGYMLLAERVRKEDEKVVVKQTLEKVMRVKLDMDSYYEKLEEKALMNVESSIVWTKAMRRLAVLVFTSIKYKEPLLLVGETGCGKTTVCQVLSQFCNQQLITVNAHQNTETSDILGAQRPVRNRFEIRGRLFNNLVSYFHHFGVEIGLEDAKLEELIKKYQIESTSNDHKEVGSLASDISSDIINSKILFEWNDGPLIHAMKNGDMFLLDEISLADDSVLERLNSVLEPERSLLLAEKGVDDNGIEDSFIVAQERFQFLATMNPGGDYGKKELSPALRNRFTEIWVPSMDDFDDVRQIVNTKLEDKTLTEVIVKFSQYYGKTCGGVTSGVISLRDILAWVSFINSSNVGSVISLLHGAAMVFIDALGTNNTSYLAENEDKLMQSKLRCVEELSTLTGENLIPYYTSDFDITLSPEALVAGSFSIPRVKSDPIDDFLLHAPTTSANTMKVIRAMQVHKPILLEGSPGVGKTSLVAAIAKATGNNLIRINLSEQTDLVDLFGSDTPAANGNTGEFVWRDAPFLRAMQRGEWVLLDEMNLASQSVLEGLNACLDHRGEAYIPELDKSFACHPQFTVFAAQNPQYQGGGRKGLPKSFVNRFTVVYVDVLKEQDLNMISQHIYPSIPGEISSKMINFVSQLEQQVVTKKVFGSSGGPWEFNLRDTLRWLELYNSIAIVKDIDPSDYFDMIICQRFRTKEDRLKVTELYESVFGPIKHRDNYFKIHQTFVQAGTSIINREKLIHFNESNKSLALKSNFRFMEIAMRCINHNLPLILTGPSNSGKTELIRYMAKITGAKINEFAMNSDVDSMDILGGYEQVDVTRGVKSVISRLKGVLQEIILNGSINMETDNSLQSSVMHQATEFYSLLDTDDLNFIVEFLKSFVSVYSTPELQDILNQSKQSLIKMTDETVKFEWFDGLLVQAVEKGYWLILDNANLCSPSVLDRLNSLLETNGSLIINECSSEDGQPRTLKPHPKFRLFLTMDPKYGELSRAMRNRGVEVYMGRTEENSIVQEAEQAVSISSFMPVRSMDLAFSQLHDLFEDKSHTMVSALTGLWQFDMNTTNWANTIQSSKEFNDTDLFYVTELEERLAVLQRLSFVDSLNSIYPKNSLFAAKNDTISSTINPAIYDVILSVIGDSVKTGLSSSEPNYFFQSLSSVLDFESKIYAIEQKAQAGNMSELSYIERSAAIELGRTIKNAPRLNIYRFLKSVNDFYVGVLKSAARDLFAATGIFKGLFELDVIRNNLLQVSHNQNESQIRAYRDLISEWLQENESLFDAGVLVEALNSFSTSLNLTSGIHMEKIWEKFRAQYPDSEDTWTRLDGLLTLFNEFDTVSIDPEALDQIHKFKVTLLTIYNDFIDGSMTDSQYSDVLTNLKTSISSLESLTSTYSNQFKPEFNLLSMFTQANGNFDETIRLSVLGGRPTIQFVNQQLFNPYPSIFNNMGYLNEGKYESLVSRLFDDSLVVNGLVKSTRFNETAGKLVKSKLKDMKVFFKELMNNYRSVGDMTVVFGDLLSQWKTEMSDMLQVSVAELSETTKALDLDNLTDRSNSTKSLGVAFVIFACQAIQSYLPSSAYDPAIKDHVLYEKLTSHRHQVQQLIDSWQTISDATSGQDIHGLEVIKDDQPQEPLKPRVYREEPFDDLFEQWKSFMDSSVNQSHVRLLLEAAEDLSDESQQLISMFQNNSSQFVHRIDTNYRKFADLNDILKGYVLALKFGYELIGIGGSEYESGVLDINDVSKMGTPLFDTVISDFVKFAKKQSVDNDMSERVMIYLMKVSQKAPNDDIISTALQAVYYRWTLRKLKESEDSLQSQSLYKYNDPDTDIEGDFKTLFPDFEDVIEDTTVKNTQNFDDIYYQLAKAYMETFSSEQEKELGSIVLEGNELISQLPSFNPQPITSSNIAVSMFSFSETYTKFSKDTGVSFNFYKEASNVETTRALGIIHGIISSTNKHLLEWPEHATLRDIVRVCNEFLEYPLSIPIARQLQKIEQIYTFIGEWEKYASSKVTLKDHFDQLTNLIVSWRRLELSTWKQLFFHEDLALKHHLGVWWFHLFETIILPLYNEESSISNVLSALHVFLSQTTFGEFSHRLELLKCFKNHILKVQGKEDAYDGISNLIKFYEQFSHKIEERKVTERKKLEKDINEVILLASWKDVNIDALKQSARKSHNSLYKIVRKYRSVLSLSVSSFIENGIEGQVPIDRSILPLVTGIVIDTSKVKELSSSVSSWNERSNRLKDLTLVDKNMDTYIKRIGDEKVPTLYSYAKEVLEQSESLKKETPSVFNEDNKKKIASLKNEKAKLLSNVLKEMRRLGLNNTAKPEVKKPQATSNSLLIVSTSFDGGLMDGVDGYYFRIIEMLPRLKAAELPGDIPVPDIEKAKGSIENLVYSLLKSRKPVVELNDSIREIETVSGSFKEVSQMYDSDESLVGSNKKVTSLIDVKSLAGQMERIIDFAIQTRDCCMTWSEAEKDDTLIGIKSQLQSYISKSFTVSTTSTVDFIESFDEFMNSTGEVLSQKAQSSSIGFVYDMVVKWMNNQERKVDTPIDSGECEASDSVVSDSVSEVEKLLRQLTNNIIVIVQKITEIQTQTISEEDDKWYEIVQSKLLKYIKSTHHKMLVNKLNTILEKITSINYHHQTSQMVSALVAFTMPIIQHYFKLLNSIMEQVREWYIENSHAGFIFVSMVLTLVTKGFCSPEAPSEEKSDDNVQDGTGLGDGEGGQNTNDVDEEDLEDEAQLENKEKEDNDDDHADEDDAVDVEGDMAGDLEDGSDQDDDDEDKEDEEMDEEIDDIDDLDPNEVDEKMWDEEAKSDKEKEGDKGGKKEEELVGGEEEAEEQQPEDNEQAEDKKEDGEEAEEGDDGDEEDVGEQEDQVNNQEGEQMDEQVEEADALDLPEDMNLDGDDDKEEEGEMEDDLDKEEGEEVKEEEGELKEEEGKEEEEEEGGEDDQEGVEGEEEQEGEEEDAEGDAIEMDQEPAEEPVEQDGSEDEALQEKPEQNEQGQEEQEEAGETLEGVDGNDQMDEENEVDIESAVKQEAGEKGEGADNQVVEEQDDLGASGGASNDQKDKEQDKEDQQDAQDTQTDEASQSMKEIGDALKEFHRRHQEIKQASEETEADTANERPDEFEHVDGENTNTDTQAMGKADEQMQGIDDDMGIDDQEEIQDQAEPETKEIKEEGQEVDDMDVDEDKETGGENEGKKAGFSNINIKQEDEMFKHDLDIELPDFDINTNSEDFKVSEIEPPMSMEVARDLYHNSELATSDLASTLCEQLRLILEPTLATKLKGDYKTGKRLNMKRIIPYIASEFRKDKIWLRRTKPSKRQYQIMIAVDDSKSMSESKSTELAYHSIALVSKALTQLESGGLSIVRFGEDVKVVHPFEKPFNSEAGARIFQYFDFQQQKTDIKALCMKSLGIFEDAKSSSSSDLWQLQIILSDGVCEDHETVSALVRRARESRIMLVFVVIDGVNESILDMSQVKYETDDVGNSVLKVNKYLDSFPFEYYVVVRDINELPEMLGLVLRQYFEVVSHIGM